MQPVRIINFHGIGEPERALEPGEAPYWIGVDRFRAILDRIVAHPDRGMLAITFDDSNLSDLVIAAPELERRSLSAEFFVLTGRIGMPGSLSASDIRELLRRGMRIGSHGVDHRAWSDASEAELDHELTASRAALEAICERPVRSAAIPFGRYNARVLRGLRKAGYCVAYTSDGGTAGASAFLRPRTSVRSDMGWPSLEAILAGDLPFARRLRRMAAMSVKRIA